MKKILLIIIPALLIAVLIFLFIQYVNNKNSQKGALQVTSSPESKVYLDNKYIGRTPLTKTDPKDMIQAGSNIRRKFNEASARTRELEASSPHSPTVLTRIGEYRTEFRTEFETDYRTLAVRLGVRR